MLSSWFQVEKFLLHGSVGRENADFKKREGDIVVL